MDSPTLASFDYGQFWLEAKKDFGYELMRNEPTLFLIDTASTATQSPETKNEKKRVGKANISDDYKATKNIAKNYGKAISSFACSSIALPYLNKILQQNHLNLEDFLDYMRVAKQSIQGIDSFRSLLLIDKEDDSLLVAKKKTFQSIGIIFIKYFSVNWIMHGKLTHKTIYLRYRFKMLRRIMNPASFTYLQSPKSKRAARK